MKPIELARSDFKQNKASVFAWIVIASFLYYHRYCSIFEDEDFDKMCSFALKNFDVMEHRLKHLVSKDDLRAGSLFALSVDKYPHGVVALAEHYSREYEIYNNTRSNVL